MPPKLPDFLPLPSDLAPSDVALVDVALLLRVAQARSADEARRHAGGARTGSGPVAQLLATLVDRVEEAERLERLAATDPLTGVANRRAFDETLAREAARAQRTSGFLTVMLVDLDGLKGINDRFGHEAGDEAIRAIADACVAAVRRSDFVARLGGDEFALILPETSAHEAQPVIERVDARLAALGSDSGYAVSASFGVASAEGALAESDTLLRLADAALYDEKRRRSAAQDADQALARPTTYAFQQSSFSTDSRLRNSPEPSPSSSLSSQ